MRRQISPPRRAYESSWFKLSSGTVLLLALALVATNPSRGDYLDWMKEQAMENARLTQPKNGWDALGNAFVMGVFNSALDAGTQRRNLLVCSFYRTDMGERTIYTIGAFRCFLILSNQPAEARPGPLLTPPNGPH